jgi:hypothetical protein
VGMNEQALYSHHLGENENGVKDFSSLELSFWSAVWLMFSVHLHPKCIITDTLHIVKRQPGWIDCLL